MPESEPPTQPNPGELDRLFDTVVGTVTLRASDLGRQADFYARAVGLTPREDAPGAVALADAQGRVLIRLDARKARGSEPLRTPHTGLFHTAFRYPDRASLAAATVRAADLAPVFQGASDHGVSEAVYFSDPEGNGVELYRDRPYDEWPQAEPGRVGMFTAPLDLQALVAEAKDPDGPATVDVGHIHLRTADADASLRFWCDVVGLDERQRFGAEAIFLAEGLYHHHVGANTWHSQGAPAAPPDRSGLDSFELRLLTPERVEAAAARLEAAGVGVAREEGQVEFDDPDSTRVILRSRT